MDPSPDQPDAMAVRVRHLLTIGLWALALVVFLHFMGPVRVLLLGILAAGAMAATLHPLTRFIPANRWVRAAAVGLVPIVVTLGVLGLLGYLLSGAIVSQLQHWPQIQQQLNGTLQSWSKRLGLGQPLTISDLLSQLGSLLTGSGGMSIFSTTTAMLSNGLIAITFVFFGGMFFLGEKPDRLLRPILLLVPEARETQVRDAFGWLIPKLRWWLIGTLISMTAIALVSGLGYYMAGLQMAWPIAILAGIAQTVPTFGPLATFVVALLLAAAEGPRTMIGVSGVYLIVQSLESYALTPYVMKRAATMPPLVTLFTVVLWGQVFGIAGLLLAVPINLVIWSFVDHLLLRPREAQRKAGGLP
jgi:predicted PurR-regulated permease PerM